MVYVELQYLGAYLLETERHGFSLEEVFEIVQYEGNCLPRLYLLVTVGMARMLATSESDEILQDLDRMVRAAWELDEYRFSLRLLLGAHLMEISRLEGLTTQLYAEVVLPELLNLVPACEDAAGQDTIDDAKKRAITTTASYDEFKSRVAGCMLKPIHKNEFNERAELVVHMNSEAVQRIFGREMDAEVFQKLLEALEQVHAAHVPAGTARRDKVGALGHELSGFPNGKSCKAQVDDPEVVLPAETGIQNAWAKMTDCEEVKGKSALDVSLRLIASLLENECTESCMELLRSTVQLLEAPGVPCPLETKLAQAGWAPEFIQIHVSALLAGDARGPSVSMLEQTRACLKGVEASSLLHGSVQPPACTADTALALWDLEGGPHRIVFTVPAMVAAVLELARLRGLQLLVGTLRQMRQGMEATSLWSIPSGEASEGTPMEGPLIFS
ncbi:Vacuolar protein sorting-associated protein 35 [Durusdinium trenchii]|uniref:Vacuolar protein sorting-associated protein 35 n=1 Tax=Durusdinium trenchii TaxID=1381693 RepID=A0ABP0I4R5_9DINO